MDAKRAVGAVTPNRWAALKQLFDQAVALDTDARKAFVAHACSVDAGLADSLANLLDHCDSTSSLLDDPAVTLERLVALIASECRAFADGESSRVGSKSFASSLKEAWARSTQPKTSNSTNSSH
jgi:hypothetical protein